MSGEPAARMNAITYCFEALSSSAQCLNGDLILTVPSHHADRAEIVHHLWDDLLKLIVDYCAVLAGIRPAARTL